MDNNIMINPVKAVLKMYKDRNCGIHKVNNACYGICSSFQGSNNNWNIQSDCGDQCAALVNEMRKGKYGVGWCDHHAPNRPVNWGQVPNYFPELFSQYKDVNKALSEAYKRCEYTKLPQECKEKALLDSYAVEQYSSLKGINSVKNYEKEHPTVFWIGFSIGFLVMLSLIYIIVKNIMK